MLGHKSDLGKGELRRMGVGRAASQSSVLGLVAGQHSAVVGQLLAHGHHLLPQQGVLLLQEGRPHRYLVLLKPSGVAGPLGCLVILVPPTPVFLVLGVRRWESIEVQRGPGHSERRSSFACSFKDQRAISKRPPGLLLAQQWGLKDTGSSLG